MTPAERAAQVYSMEPCARSFQEDLEAHLLNGIVVSTPEIFLMARMVPRNGEPSLIVNPWMRWHPRLCDAWLIYLASGNLQKFFDLEGVCGEPKEWLAWERKNVLRFHPYQRTKALCTNSLTTMNAFAGRTTRAACRSTE